MPRLLALVSKPPGVSPGQRFRLEQWAPHLAADHDIALDFLVFESPRLTEVLYRPGHTLEKARLTLGDFWRRREVLQKAREYDGVVLYREAALLGPAIYERLLHRAGIPMILDFDDAIWISSSKKGKSASGAFSYLRFAGKTATVCRIASAVVAGNRYLAEYARKRLKHVFIVPTSIDLTSIPFKRLFPPRSRSRSVWSGSLTTLAHLEGARSALEEAWTPPPRRPQGEYCNSPPERPFANVENVFVPWSEKGEAEAMGQLTRASCRSRMTSLVAASAR